MAEALIGLTSTIRAKFEASPEWQETRRKAYPAPAPVDKLAKKVKKTKISKGEGKPGANGEEAKAEGEKAEGEAA